VSILVTLPVTRDLTVEVSSRGEVLSILLDVPTALRADPQWKNRALVPVPVDLTEAERDELAERAKQVFALAERDDAKLLDARDRRAGEGSAKGLHR